jgi:type II secretory pathway pseudopilin PulG
MRLMQIIEILIGLTIVGFILGYAAAAVSQFRRTQGRRDRRVAH